MKRDSVGCQFNFEIDPVVAVNIEGDVHYHNLKSAIKEGRPSCMVCFPQLLGFRSEEGARESRTLRRIPNSNAGGPSYRQKSTERKQHKLSTPASAIVCEHQRHNGREKRTR